MRPRRTWSTVRVVEGRQRWLAALAKRAKRSIADVLEDILGEYESALALAEASEDKYDIGEG